MSDLSSLFRSGRDTADSNPYSISRSANRNRNSIMSTPYNRLGSSPLSDMECARDGSGLSQSDDAKRVITYNNMQQEVSWFFSNYQLEGTIKILIILMITIALILFRIVHFGLALTLFIYAFFKYALAHGMLSHRFFISQWGCASLYLTFFVLVNQLFQSLLRISRSGLSDSLLPSLHLTILLGVLQYSSRLMYLPDRPKSLMDSLLGMGYTLLFELPRKCWSIKWTIAIFYLSTYLLVHADYPALISYKWEEYSLSLQGVANHAKTMSLMYKCINDRFVVQVATLFTVLINEYFLCQIVSEGVSNQLLVMSYTSLCSTSAETFNYKLLDYSHKKINGVPMLLELLRINNLQSDVLDRLTRDEIECMQLQALKWIQNICSWNPDALNTKLTASKFYHNYWDIFKEFAETELAACLTSILQLQVMVESLRSWEKRPKVLRQDIFFRPRVWALQIRIWVKALSCCRYLEILGEILEVLCEANKPDMYSPLGIEKTLTEICSTMHRIGAKNTKYLSPVVGEKLRESCSRIRHIVSKED